MMGNQNPVGVFDSGVGGIGTLSALRRELPQEDFLYFGDTLHAPYGTKPREEVMACVTRVMTHLLSNHVKAVVIACNTATAVAAKELRETYDLPILGMEPALKPAHAMRHGGSILVLATPMTLRQFIKFQAAHDLARAGNAAVVERRAAAGLIRPDDHRAEFIDIERLIMVSAAHRLIQHRAGAVELDPNGQRQHDDAAGDEQNQRKQEVDDALDNVAVKRMGQRSIPARHLRKWLL